MRKINLISSVLVMALVPMTLFAQERSTRESGAAFVTNVGAAVGGGYLVHESNWLASSSNQSRNRIIEAVEAKATLAAEGSETYQTALANLNAKKAAGATERALESSVSSAHQELSKLEVLREKLLIGSEKHVKLVDEEVTRLGRHSRVDVTKFEEKYFALATPEAKKAGHELDKPIAKLQAESAELEKALETARKHSASLGDYHNLEAVEKSTKSTLYASARKEGIGAEAKTLNILARRTRMFEIASLASGAVAGSAAFDAILSAVYATGAAMPGRSDDMHPGEEHYWQVGPGSIAVDLTRKIAKAVDGASASAQASAAPAK